MCRALSDPQAKPPTRRSRILRCIAIIAVATIVALGIAVLVTWLVLSPSPMDYVVEDGSIHGFHLRRNTLNATFELVIRADNPNRRVSIYYDYIDVEVWLKDQMIAFADHVSPFFQPHRNRTRLNVRAEALAMPLHGYVSKELKHDRSSGNVELDVQMQGRIRFKVGLWKSKHYNLKVLCPSVKLYFSSSDSFQKTDCQGVFLQMTFMNGDIFAKSIAKKRAAGELRSCRVRGKLLETLV
ncbi:hypothetical protein ACLOJK_024778 [Asimina triloba]